MNRTPAALSAQFSSPSTSESSSSSGMTFDIDGTGLPTKRATSSDNSSNSGDSISDPDFYQDLLRKPRNSDESNWLMSVKLGWMLKGTKELIASIDNTEIPRSHSRVTTKYSEVHGSYSWATRKNATIYVPGGPRVFKAGDGKGRFAPTAASPRKYIDENGARMPLYHFEPMFRALMAANHPYKYNDVDLVTDSTTLHKLLQFCIGGCEVQGFRIDVNIVRETMFLTLREKHGKPSFKDDEAAGAGLRFPTKLAEPRDSLKDSSSFWRILRYNLGKLNCVVRSEVDAAYHGDNVSQNTKLPALGHLVTGLGTKESTHNGERSTRVIVRGRTTHAGVTARIATKRRGNTRGEFMPQMYFDRTRWLLGVSQKVDNKGPYLVTEATNVMMRFRKWQKFHQESLQKLVKLLKTIRNFAEDNGGKCIAICEHQAFPPKLHIFSSRMLSDPLPEDIIAKFWSDGEGNKEQDGVPSPRSQRKGAVSMSILMDADEDDSDLSSEEEDLKMSPTRVHRVDLDLPQSQQIVADLRRSSTSVCHDIDTNPEIENEVRQREQVAAGQIKSSCEDNTMNDAALRDTNIENKGSEDVLGHEMLGGESPDQHIFDDDNLEDYDMDIEEMLDEDVNDEDMNEEDEIDDVEIPDSDDSSSGNSDEDPRPAPPPTFYDRRKALWVD